MWNHRLEVLTRVWIWLWRRSSRVVAKNRLAESRARFWVELREGQREAETHAIQKG